MPVKLQKIFYLAAKDHIYFIKTKFTTHCLIYHIKTKFTIICLIYFVRMIWAPNAKFTSKDIIFCRKTSNLLHKDKIHLFLPNFLNKNKTHYQLPHLLHKNDLATECQINFK